MTSFFTFDFSKVSGSSDYDYDVHDYDKREKFGRTIFWLENRHVDADEVEKHRMIGDEEVDTLLELISSSLDDGQDLFFEDTKHSCYIFLLFNSKFVEMKIKDR